MMMYQTIVKERMVRQFPEDLLGGTFRGKAYPHIFNELKDNFIDGDVPKKKCLKGNLTETEIKYHYAEHLNSSQTMCIAFFKKFFESEENESLFAKILMMQKINVADTNFTDAVFEYIPDAKECTNFDFYLKLANGRQITWEIKFTESEFGCITPDKKTSKRYIDKWEKIYTSMLTGCAYYNNPVVVCNNYKCLTTGEITNDCWAGVKCSICCGQAIL